MTGLFVLSPASTTDFVTSRIVTYQLNGGPNLTVDMTSGAATFPCSTGDVITGTAVDTNAIGASAPSPVFTVTAPPEPTAVPTTPTIMSVTFTP